MIALLSALLGFVSSALPEFVRLFRDGKDRAHEVTLLKLQMEYEQQKATLQTSESKEERALRLEAIALETQRVEELALNARLKDQFTGIHWVDALSGSVRPVLTYGFFLLYVSIKLAQFHLMVAPVLPWSQPFSGAQAIVALWTEEDVAIFSAIMAFWFGSRVMQRRYAR